LFEGVRWVAVRSAHEIDRGRASEPGRARCPAGVAQGAANRAQGHGGGLFRAARGTGASASATRRAPFGGHSGEHTGKLARVEVLAGGQAEVRAGADNLSTILWRVGTWGGRPPPTPPPPPPPPPHPPPPAGWRRAAIRRSAARISGAWFVRGRSAACIGLNRRGGEGRRVHPYRRRRGAATRQGENTLGQRRGGDALREWSSAAFARWIARIELRFRGEHMMGAPCGARWTLAIRGEQPGRAAVGGSIPGGKKKSFGRRWE